jgi:uncharacterized protein
MRRKYPELTFNESVVERQAHYGVRASGVKMEELQMDDEHLSITELAFIAQRDSFYMATVNAEGWPYVQYRGGPVGFLKALDTTTLAYADFRGNRQFISMGNLRTNNRVSLFFMDYPGRKRLKLMATTEVFDVAERPDLLPQVEDPSYQGKVERIVLFHLAAFDWNCPQHITPRLTEAEWAAGQPS